MFWLEILFNLIYLSPEKVTFGHEMFFKKIININYLFFT